MRKFLAVLRMSARGKLASRGVVVGRALFYALLLFVFARLWHAVGSEASPRIWYLAVTELLTLATPFLCLDIESEVKRGDLAYGLLRPVSYLTAKLGEGGGEGIVRFAHLLPVGAVCGYAFAGGWPDDPRGLLFAVPLALLSMGVFVLFQAAIGLSAVWLHEAAPLHWLVQKLSFLLGGLLFPLDIYPRWLRAIAEATPFPSLVYGPGRLVFAYDPMLALVILFKILFWGAVAYALVLFLFRAATRRLEVHGG